MSTKPILFNSKMVQAILDGKKTQTRRPVRDYEADKCRYGEVGDRHFVGDKIIELTSIRRELLSDISEEDAIAEGIEEAYVLVDVACEGGVTREKYDYRYFNWCNCEGFETAVEAFFDLWGFIYDVPDQLVWVIEFKKVDV